VNNFLRRRGPQGGTEKKEERSVKTRDGLPCDLPEHGQKRRRTNKGLVCGNDTKRRAEKKKKQEGRQ